MKVTLLEPAFNGRGIVKQYGFKVLPYGLLQLASVTPPGIEVEIFDEKVEPLPETLETDLIGISVFTTANAPRAYELAARYRSQGIPVVLGGTHPSALPEEALRFADSVVLGEGEVVWPEVLKDFQRGALKPLYAAPLPDLTELPSRHPWHLLKTERYPAPTVLQTTRGCPIGCEFCSVTSFNGKKMRHKRFDQIFQELEELFTVQQSVYARVADTVFFLDDSFGTDVLFYKALMQAMVERGVKIRWVTQATTAIAQKSELLTLAQKSGCVGVLIGFESLSQESLREADKSYKARQYEEIIKKLHDHGMGVEGTFIFGFDHDDEGVFERTVEFCERTRLNVAQFSALTPLPGTRLFERFRAEGRFLDEPWRDYRLWAKFNLFEVVIRPKQMSPERLAEGLQWTYRTFYSLPSLARRFSHHLFRQSVRDTLVTWTLNWGFRHLREPAVC
ncbi:MAG: B12-binding domain-containing radical SAM protein [candidate division NC10 bacterium]|nr:B12-binding domain-containing radical SAM protein [candidate division NC10 bacterium]